MPLAARIKFKANIPWEVEQRLIQKHCFYVHSRRDQHFVIMARNARPQYPKTAEILVNGVLPEHVQNELLARIKRIINIFLDPDAHQSAIHSRLMNMANCLPPFQKRFVEDWIENNLGGT